MRVIIVMPMTMAVALSLMGVGVAMVVTAICRDGRHRWIGGAVLILARDVNMGSSDGTLCTEERQHFQE